MSKATSITVLFVSIVTLTGLVFSAPLDRRNTDCTNGGGLQVQTGLAIANFVLKGKLIRHLTATNSAQRKLQLDIVHNTALLGYYQQQLQKEINNNPTDSLAVTSSVVNMTLDAACQWIKSNILTDQYQFSCTQTELNQIKLILSTYINIVAFKDVISTYAPLSGNIAACYCSRFYEISTSTDLAVGQYISTYGPLICSKYS